MQVSINIDCETAQELDQHLQTIRHSLKTAAKKDPFFRFEDGLEFSDNNCYGSHEVTIKEE